jgi:ketosteroid isomerase-like protein
MNIQKNNAAANKALLHHIYAEASRRNPAPLLAALAEDAVWTIIGSTFLSGTFRGKDEILTKLLGPLAASTENGVTFTIDRLIAEDDHVVLIAKGSATAKTGRPYNNTYCIVARFADNKIVEMTDYIDTELITAALGV